MEAAWRAAGGASGYTVSELGDLNIELHNLTGIATATIDEALAIQQTFHNISGETFPQTTLAAADMATVMGTDLKAAMQQVAFAVNDPINGVTRLTRSGVQFTDVQRDMIREFIEMGDTASAQAIVLGELESQFGGAAEAMRGTARGTRMAWEETMDFLKASAGQAIEEALRPGKEAIIEWVAENREEIALVFQNLPEFAAIAFETAQDIMRKAFEPETLQAIFGQVGHFLFASVQAGVISIMGSVDAMYEGVLAGAEVLGSNWPKALTNAAVRALDAPGRALLGLMGVKFEEGPSVPFDIDVTFSDAFFTGLSTAGNRFAETYAQQIKTMIGETKGLGEGLADLFAEETDEAARKFSELMSGLKAEKKELESEESLPGITDPGETTSDVNDLNEELEKLMENLRDQAAVAGMSADAIKIYRLEIEGATDAHLAEARELQGIIRRKEEESAIMSRSAAIYANLVGLGGSWNDQLSQLHEEYESGAISLSEYASALEGLEEKSNAALKMQEQFDQAIENLNVRIIEGAVTEFADAIFDIGTAFGDGSISAETFGEAVGNVGRQLMRMIPTMAVAAGLQLLFANPNDPRGWWLLGGGITGMLGAGFVEGAITENAHGNVYENGSVTPFANGGIVTKPTIFPMASGAGLMGEAGPEAIMPLARTASGDLGVRAAGGNTYVTVINNSENSAVRTEESTRANGEKEIMVFIENIVDQGIARGRFDKSNAKRYGSVPKGVRV